MSRKRAFTEGIELFKNNRFDGALEAFNEAIRENGEDKILLDSRAAVFERLGRPIDSLKDCKKVIHLAPSSWQGYLRSARLFLSIENYEASLKMADLAFERIKSDDTKRRDELEEIRKHAVEALKSQTCHFFKLPLELQIEIFTLVIGDSDSKMLALTRICRRWRDVVIGTPRFWRYLSVTPWTTLKKVDTWLHRADGLLSSLHISSGRSLEQSLRVLKNVGPNFWSSLDALDIDASGNDREDCPPEEFLKHLQLKSLRLLFSEAHSREYVQKSLRSVDISQARHFVLSSWTSECIRLTDLTTTTLTTLQLKCNFRPGDIRVILKRNPLLVKFIIEHNCSYALQDDDSEDSASSVALVNLKYLELRSCLSRMDFISNLFCPNLEVLHVTGSPGWVIDSLQASESWPFTHLKYCILEQCFFFSSDALISLLQRAKRLKALRLSLCTTLDKEEECMIEALARTPLCCPLLQHVDLSHSPRLKSGPIVRLVKAHLPKTTTSTCTDESDEATMDEDPTDLPLPIISLNIDDCPMVDPDALPWLRANVPRFSCKMKVEKMGRRKG